MLSERERPQPLAVSASKPFGEEASAQGATRSEAKEHYDTSDTKMKYEYEYETYCEYMLEPKCANAMLTYHLGPRNLPSGARARAIESSPDG